MFRKFRTTAHNALLPGIPGRGVGYRLVDDHLVQLLLEPYAPIRRQLLNILRAVNTKRKLAGKGPVPTSALRLRRRVAAAKACACCADSRCN